MSRSYRALPVLGLMFVGTCVAQPVLTVDNSFPLLGESFIELSGTALDPGMPGAGQVWDFSAFQAQDTLMFSCTGPISDSIGGCPLETWVERENGDYVVANDPVSLMVAPWFGFPFGTLPTIVERSITLLPPLAFGDTVLSSHLLRLLNNGCDAFYVYRSDTSIADGYGTLVLPSGTYGPILRVRSMSGSAVPGEASSEAYRYYLPGTHHPLVTIAQSFPTPLDASWTMRVLDPSSIVGLVDHRSTGATLRIWPQPVQDVLHVVGPLGASGTATWEVLNAEGRLLRQWSAGVDQVRVDVSFLANGLYVLRVLGSDGVNVSTTFIKDHP